MPPRAPPWRAWLALMLLAGCGNPAPGEPARQAAQPVHPAATTASAPAAVSSPAAASPGPAHLFLIVMENKSFEQAMSGPYTASLAGRYEVLSGYHAVSHPSLPNYLALSSGSTWGITDDAYHALPPGGIGTQLTAAGISWKAYMEGMTHGCTESPYPYALKHNPFAYYGGGCPAAVVPLTELETDLAGPTPRFAWITPDLCHDTHDCSLATGDQWLSQIVPEIMSSPAWQAGDLLFITWDEDDGSEQNHVATIVVAGGLTHHQTPTPYDHYSLLATVEDSFGLVRLGEAARAQPIAL